MAYNANSTVVSETHGPVTAAIRAMRVEPEPAPPARRLFLRALAALPVIGMAVGVAAPAMAAPVLSDHETRFLGLIPWFARVVPEGARPDWPR
ncbi:MAG: hypothetical protein PGN25_05775 [Methylorubrum populi]